MINVEAPDRVAGIADKRSIFLAGGIMGCPDWHREAMQALETTELVVFNPRRRNFPMGDPNASYQQILWEHEHLRQATAIWFWFPKETLCPIALYELGAWSMTTKPLFVGVHPEYQRRVDVEIQTKLVRPELAICYSIPELLNQVGIWLG